MLALAALALGSGEDTRDIIGHSVRGERIVVKHHGDLGAEREVLVVGSIHGDEQEGHRIVRRLVRREARRLDGVELLTIKTVNPDGVAANTRGNAHSVDLNRNFPHDWKPIPPSSGYYSGPKPTSEPETKAVLRYLRAERPDITIWYHQPWGKTLIPCGEGGGRRVALRYARLSGLPPRDCFPSPPGSVTGWERAKLGAKAFVVELPDGKLGRGAVRRHAAAVAEIADPGR
jgi:murein peptide amidase A